MRKQSFKMFMFVYKPEDVKTFPSYGVLFHKVPESFYELDEAYLSIRVKFSQLEEAIVYVNDNNPELLVEVIKMTRIFKKKLTFIWPDGHVQKVIDREDDLRAEFKFNMYRCVELWKDLLEELKGYYGLRTTSFVEIVFGQSVDEMLEYYGEVVDVRSELEHFDEFTKWEQHED